MISFIHSSIIQYYSRLATISAGSFRDSFKKYWFIQVKQVFMRLIESAVEIISYIRIQTHV